MATLDLRSLTPRIVLSTIISAGFALLMVVLAANAARTEMQQKLDAHLTSDRRVAECVASPETWGGEEGPAWLYAYDEHGQSSNPDAPPLEPGLMKLWLDGHPDRIEDPTNAEKLVLLKAAGTGPCAAFRLDFHGPPFEFWTLWRFGSLVVLSMLTVAGLSYAFTVRPLLARVSTLAELAKNVGNPKAFAQHTSASGDQLDQIGNALEGSHTRIVQDRAELLARHVALEEHMASIAHDLRTPLAALQLSIEFLANDPGSDEEAQAGRRAIADAMYLGALVENLHQAVRLRHGLDAREGTVDLRDVVTRVGARFAVLGEVDGVDVAVSTPERPVVVQCTPALAERAVANLVHNAVVNGVSNGHVAVLLDAGAPGQSQFSLTVLDDGPGVREDVLADLAHRTFQTDAARQRGQGLGIAITNEVVQRAGWNIVYEAGEDGGLRVCIRGEHLS